MEVVVLVPVPALRRAVEGREGAVVVVAVVTGRGLGRLVVVVGRVRVAVVVVGAVVMTGGGAWWWWWWRGRCPCLLRGVA